MANHQLQTLRPYLIHTAAQFELKMFQENRQKAALLTLETTRRWLQAAFDELATQNVVSNPASVCSSFSSYPRHLQVQVAVVKAVVALIFDPPSCRVSPPTTPLSSPPSSPPSSPQAPNAVRSREGYPETLYLDHVRLRTLRNDAADLTTMYMLLMLYRQLVHSGSMPAGPKTAVTKEELVALKKEIWEIGPARLGFYSTSKPPSGLADSPGNAEKLAELDTWRKEMDDVVLQITTRAGEARSRCRAPKVSLSTATPIASDQRPIPSQAPDSTLLKLATSWTGSHLRPDSPLSALMKKRVRQAVEELTVQIVLPTLSLAKKPSFDEAERAASGLEPLTAEIRLLAEKLSKLVTIHLNVYGTLYTQPGFILDRAPSQPLVKGDL